MIPYDTDTKLRSLVRMRMRAADLSYSKIAFITGNSPSASRLSGWLAGKHDISASSVENVLSAISATVASRHLGADPLDDL